MCWQGDQLFAVVVSTSPELRIGEPRFLFRTTLGTRARWFERDRDVASDGQSIYLARTPDLLRPREIRIVLNWMAEVASLAAESGGR